MTDDLRRLITLIETASAPPADEDTWEITIPSMFYRGSEARVTTAHINEVYRTGDAETADLPADIQAVLPRVHGERVYGLDRSLPFKVSRTYNGMSNWGFGVYFGSDLAWATRYGKNIVTATVDPGSILAIRDRDFAKRNDEPGGRLAQLLYSQSDLVSEQARLMTAAVKKIKKTAKALYVSTEADRGQLCVFTPSVITPRYYFELKE